MTDFQELWAQLKLSIDRDRLAHAYIIEGAPKGAAGAFAERLVQYLFCTGGNGEVPCGVCSGCERIAGHNHPDVAWIEPQSKSRQILVDQIDQHILRLHQTPFEGGWKVAGILYADRINETSSNKFLKTLEEPPGKSLILLVTDAPEALLPTIRSRCQRITVASTDAERQAGWYVSLLKVLRMERPTGPLGGLLLSGSLVSILQQMKKDETEREMETAEEEDDEKVLDARVQARVKEMTAALLRTMQDWYRDVLMLKLAVDPKCLHFPEEQEALEATARAHSLPQCHEWVRQVDEIARRLNRNLSVPDVLDTGLSSRAARSA